MTGLQLLFTTCESELERLVMRVNSLKSMCIRFGPRFDFPCAEIISCNGVSLKWIDSCRYLGVHFKSGRTFRCSYENSKQSFFRAFNAILSKVGRSASEETILALIRAKCLPILLYATEVCPMRARDRNSLEFTITRTLMKLFHTGSAAIIAECQRHFKFLPMYLQVTIRTAKFLNVFVASQNQLCLLFENVASRQLKTILNSFGVNTYVQMTRKIWDDFLQPAVD